MILKKIWLQHELIDLSKNHSITTNWFNIGMKVCGKTIKGNDLGSRDFPFDGGLIRVAKSTFIYIEY